MLKKEDFHEFRPLLAEIEESPVSPLGRLTFWIIVSVILFFALWLFFGKVDIVVSARGQVIPDGEVKILQPLDTGVVSNILVKEGDYVKKGQVLLEIDPSTTEPQLQSLQENLAQIQLEKDRLRAASYQTPYSGGGSSESAITQKEAYLSSMGSLQKQLNVKYAELKKTNEEIKATKADEIFNREMLAKSAEQEKRLSAVIDIIAKEQYERVTGDIANYTSKIDEDTFKLQELSHQKDQTMEEIGYLKDNFKTENLKELSDRQKQSTELEAQIHEISFKNTKQRIISPVDGFVTKLLIHTTGGVITPAEKLLAIVPASSPLVIKANVINKDIGFVKEGMPVSVKIDTFDFQKYGILNGKVSIISKNSLDDPKLGPVFETYVTPIDKSLMVEGKREYISPGMSLTAEIKVGKRRIIEFFIYPLIKYLNEGISVR